MTHAPDLPLEGQMVQVLVRGHPHRDGRGIPPASLQLHGARGRTDLAVAAAAVLAAAMPDEDELLGQHVYFLAVLRLVPEALQVTAALAAMHVLGGQLPQAPHFRQTGLVPGTVALLSFLFRKLHPGYLAGPALALLAKQHPVPHVHLLLQFGKPQGHLLAGLGKQGLGFCQHLPQALVVIAHDPGDLPQHRGVIRGLDGLEDTLVGAAGRLHASVLHGGHGENKTPVQGRAEMAQDRGNRGGDSGILPTTVLPSRNRASSEAVRVSGGFLLQGATNRPCSRRLARTQRPVPSQ